MLLLIQSRFKLQASHKALSNIQLQINCEKMEIQIPFWIKFVPCKTYFSFVWLKWKEMEINYLSLKNGEIIM